MFIQRLNFLKYTTNLAALIVRFPIATIFLLSLLCSPASGYMTCGSEHPNMSIAVRSGLWSIPGTTFKPGGGTCYWAGGSYWPVYDKTIALGNSGAYIPKDGFIELKDVRQTVFRENGDYFMGMCDGFNWYWKFKATVKVHCCVDNDKDGYFQNLDGCTPIDCDDTNAAIHPGATEICDNQNNDCDGQTDEGLSWDNDGDGHYRPDSCYSVTPRDDCNESALTAYPGAPELCTDTIDNDCDEEINEGCCDLKVESFTGSVVAMDATIRRDIGGDLKLSGSISDSSEQPVSWSSEIGGKNFTGNGKSVAYTWDGKNPSGKVIDVGSHTATLHGQRVDKPDCGDSKPLNFTVTPTANPCKLKVAFGSSANIAGGELTDSLPFFSLPGNGPNLGLTLHYASLDNFSGALGLGWSHSYESNLRLNDFGEAIMRLGDGSDKLYIPDGGGFVAQPGDSAILVKNPDNSFTRTRKDGTYESYDADGRLLALTDRNGNALTFVYADGLLQTVSDSAGRSISFAYDGNGHFISITDPAGQLYTFTVGETLESVTFPDNGVWRYGYAANAFLTTKTDPLDHLTTYSYDDQHRVVASIDPEGRSRAITYPTADETVRTTTFTEKDGGLWLYSYDTVAGDLLAKTDPLGNVTTYTYDAAHNQTSKSDASGTTTALYDVAGNLTDATDVAGETTRYSYNAFGQVTSITSPDGGVTRYDYDERGNLTSTTDASGATTSYSYDSVGRTLSVTAPDGGITRMGYDTAGNLSSVTDPSGATQRLEYDANGRVIKQIDPQGGVTTLEYDSRGNLSKSVDPLGNVSTATYDANGRKTSVTDANGNTTRFETNAQGQVLKSIDALDNVTSYAYGGSGCPSCGGGGGEKLSSLTDANGQTTIFEYDPLGRLSAETDPLGNATTYSYDARGNLATKTDANGNTIRYSYDLLGRLVKKVYPDASEETFSYDSRGNILSAANINASDAFTYDVSGRTTSVTDGGGQMIQYRYDSAGRKSQTSYPDGSIVSQGYDNAGRLQEIRNGGGRVYRFDYDTAGRRSSITFPNGVVTSYSYNTAGQLTNLTHKNAGGTVIAANSYTIDKTGNRLTNKTPERTLSYQYDVLYRLTDALSSTSGNSANATGKGKGIATATQQQKEFYTYDPVGNRLSSEKTPLYSYNVANQLLTNGGSYRYDKNGNLIEKVTNEGSTTYSWDYENRLVKVDLPSGAVAEYAYDPFGRRVEKRITENGSANITRYGYDNEDIILEYDGSGNVANKYVHGPGIDEPLAVTQGKETYFYHADGLGSIVALTDKSGKVVQDYQYDSFGNLKDLKNRIKQPYTYTGREYDRETGMYYYRARYYDAAAGRFTQKDPIGFKGGINQFLYVQANPINATDPSGLRTFVCKTPLHAVGGNGQRSGPDIWGNPLYHQYICVITSDGQEICGGQDRSGGPWSPGKPSDFDLFSPNNCSQKDTDNPCLEECLIGKINDSSRPYYGLFGPGTNCQEWANDTYKKCKSSN